MTGHAPTPGAIAVQYQLANWKAQHFSDPAKAAEAVLLFKALGCEVQQSGHAGHTDVNVRCTSTSTLVCTSHEQAHGLQAWLNQNGFQTQHTH